MFDVGCCLLVVRLFVVVYVRLFLCVVCCLLLAIRVYLFVGCCLVVVRCLLFVVVSPVVLVGR